MLTRANSIDMLVSPPRDPTRIDLAARAIEQVQGVGGPVAAVQFARSLSRNVTAVVVDIDSAATNLIRDRWSTSGVDECFK